LDRAVSSDLDQAANFPNFQNEVAGTDSAAAPVNQNIIVADNTFATNRPQACVNVSSANNVLFTGSSFGLDVQPAHLVDFAATTNWFDRNDDGPRRFPVSVHDASNIFFGNTDTYSSALPDTACTDSIMRQLSDRPPKRLPTPCVGAFAISLAAALLQPQLALAQASPFLTGANSPQTNILAWLTPLASISKFRRSTMVSGMSHPLSVISALAILSGRPVCRKIV
jgi:hypothetical protein